MHTLVFALLVSFAVCQTYGPIAVSERQQEDSCGVSLPSKFTAYNQNFVSSGKFCKTKAFMKIAAIATYKTNETPVGKALVIHYMLPVGTGGIARSYLAIVMDEIQKRYDRLPQNRGNPIATLFEEVFSTLPGNFGRDTVFYVVYDARQQKVLLQMSDSNKTETLKTIDNCSSRPIKDGRNVVVGNACKIIIDKIEADINK